MAIQGLELWMKSQLEDPKQPKNLGHFVADAVCESVAFAVLIVWRRKGKKRGPFVLIFKTAFERKCKKSVWDGTGSFSDVIENNLTQKQGWHDCWALRGRRDFYVSVFAEATVVIVP